jgi:DNA-directed RNA polymerase subunit K/omega
MEKETAVKGKVSESISSKEIERDHLDGTLDKLMLDTTLNKYDIVVLARRWAYELRSKDGETRSLQELIAVAIQDILASRVSHKMVRDLPFLNFKNKKNISAQVLETLAKNVEALEKKGSKKDK